MITLEDTPEGLLVYQDDKLLTADTSNRIEIVRSNTERINTSILAIVSNAGYYADNNPDKILGVYTKKEIP